MIQCRSMIARRVIHIVFSGGTALFMPDIRGLQRFSLDYDKTAAVFPQAVCRKR